MTPKPFNSLKVGDLFRDLDGNKLVKTPKANPTQEGIFSNILVLVSNNKDVKRGDLIKKARDSYCEVLESNEEIILTGNENFSDPDKEIVISE